MTARTQRLSVNLEGEVFGIVAKIAAKTGQSTSAFARDLMLDALERREDLALSNLAKKRDKNTQKTIKHQDAWK